VAATLVERTTRFTEILALPYGKNSDEVADDNDGRKLGHLRRPKTGPAEQGPSPARQRRDQMPCLSMAMKRSPQVVIWKSPLVAK